MLKRGFSVYRWILLLLTLAWAQYLCAMPETGPVCLWDARPAGFCVRGTDVRGTDQVLFCEMMCIHDVGQLNPALAVQSRTVPQHPRVVVYMALLGHWGPYFLGSWAALCRTEEVSSRVHVIVSPSVPCSETEVAQELLRSQSWVFPPYVHPLLLPAPPSHFQQPSWVTVSPWWAKEVSHSCKAFF